VFCEDYELEIVFCEDCDHGCSPNKDLKTRHFFEDCDCNPNKEDCEHGYSYTKTQKYNIFVRSAITIAVLRTVTMVTVL